MSLDCIIYSSQKQQVNLLFFSCCFHLLALPFAHIMWNPSRATAALELGQVSRKHLRLQFPWLLVGADSSYILLAWYLTLPIIIESWWSPLLSIPNEVPALLPHPSASVPRNRDAGPAIVALDGMTQTSLHYYCMLHAIERISNVRETT